MTTPVFANSTHLRAVERLVLKGGAWQARPIWVRCGLYLSKTAGPVLIDTGYTQHVTSAPGRSVGLRLYNQVLRPPIVPEATPDRFLARFGLRCDDVARVVVTHFHADHVSGLSLFPQGREFCARGRGCGSLP